VTTFSPPIAKVLKVLTMRLNKLAKENRTSEPPPPFRDQCPAVRIRNQMKVCFPEKPEFMSCHWSQMDDKISMFLKRELIAGFGGRCGVGVDWSLGTLKSKVAAADYQPSFPLHTAAKSQVPRLLILHTKRLKMVHGDLKG
jgi:hypothetical protein